MSGGRKDPVAIALTGGIASGKTTVANAFAALGATLCDADVIARELVAPGQPALDEIVLTFGTDMLTPQGELDRRRMRERVFADDVARRKLESILHPRVRAELRARAQACSAPYCLLAIPLLAESDGAYDWIDRVLVVDVTPATQLARLMQRDSMTAEGAQRALAAQATRAQRLALADDVIDNSFLPEDLRAPVQRLHELYRELASARPAP
ncbi:MAG: dephospho-CoA kinase [Gammaproteobacteria bacterium]|nr:MAG: dephospho-CoA kinase [Gammaproteobacteria bacterium]